MTDGGALKTRAAERALEFLREVRLLGLGTGSTAERFTRRVGELCQAGELGDLLAVPTSDETARLARQLGIPLTTLDEHPELDLTVDGADEVDPRLDAIKGLGGALTREKIVAHASRQFVIIVDESKRVERLGTRGPVPIEVLPFAGRPVERALRAQGATTAWRAENGGRFRTDEANFILDAGFGGGIPDPEALNQWLNGQPGIVEHGLFLGMADAVVVASESGVEVLERPI